MINKKISKKFFVFLIILLIFSYSANASIFDDFINLVGFAVKTEGEKCDPGWKCFDNTMRGYQNPQCKWVSLVNCEYGCDDGICNERPKEEVAVTAAKPVSERCEQGWKCYNANTRGHQSTSCKWTLLENCPNGCSNGKCNTGSCEGVSCPDYCSGSIKYYSGSCSNGQCSYSSLDCNSFDNFIDNNYCLNDNVYRNFRNYYCSIGNCAFNDEPILQQLCEFGCENGVCKQDPCSGISCPDSQKTCADGYVASCTNSCSNGVCSQCIPSCVGHEDKCAGISCNTPPNQCYNPQGTCSNGVCSYTKKSAGASCNDNNVCTLNDACDANAVCKGTLISCPDVCADNKTLDYAGSCSNGNCVYKQQTCSYKCAGGVCINATQTDPCQNIICDESTKTCPDGFVAKCSNTCSNGICTNCTPDCSAHMPSCEGITCNSYCNGTIFYSSSGCVDGKCIYSSQDCNQLDSFASSNICKNGSVYKSFNNYYCTEQGCAYQVEDLLQQACPYGCENGVCKTDLCLNVQCPNTCLDNLTLVFNGACSEGICIYDQTTCSNGCQAETCLNITLPPTVECNIISDGICPKTCSADSDLDCCAQLNYCWVEGRGCYETCEAGICSYQPNNICPVNCAAGTDADCCLEANKCWIQEDNACYDGLKPGDNCLYCDITKSTTDWSKKPECAAGFCGDNVCDLNETITSCAQDCGQYNATVSYCGDGKCSAGETELTCSADCPQDTKAPTISAATLTSYIPTILCDPYCGNAINASVLVSDNRAVELCEEIVDEVSAYPAKLSGSKAISTHMCGICNNHTFYFACYDKAGNVGKGGNFNCTEGVCTGAGIPSPTPGTPSTTPIYVSTVTNMTTGLDLSSPDLLLRPGYLVSWPLGNISNPYTWWPYLSYSGGGLYTHNVYKDTGGSNPETVRKILGVNETPLILGLNQLHLPAQTIDVTTNKGVIKTYLPASSSYYARYYVAADGSTYYTTLNNLPDTPNLTSEQAFVPQHLARAPNSTIFCGDNICNNNESCKICPNDCGYCGVSCGDGVCHFSEDNKNCLADCPSIKLTSAFDMQSGPRIDGNYIVWTDYRNYLLSSDGVDIYGYDLSLGKEFRISSKVPNYYSGGCSAYNIPNEVNQWSPYVDSSGKVVYVEPAHICGDAPPYCSSCEDIYMYDFSTGKTTNIVGDNLVMKRNPKLIGNKVIWEAIPYYGGQILIYAKDLTTGEATNLGDSFSTKVYDNGYVVRGPFNYTNGSKYKTIYDLKTNKFIANISDPLDNSGYYMLHDFYGANAVYTKDVYTNNVYTSRSLVVYNLLTKTKKEIPDPTLSIPYARIFGNILVYSKKTGDEQGIYYYNLKTNEEKVIEKAKYYANPDIYMNKIVWSGNKVLNDYMTRYEDIYMYTLPAGLVDPNYGLEVPAPITPFCTTNTTWLYERNGVCKDQTGTYYNYCTRASDGWPITVRYNCWLNSTSGLKQCLPTRYACGTCTNGGCDVFCNDSDGGINLLTKGSVKASNVAGELIDRCDLIFYMSGRIAYGVSESYCYNSSPPWISGAIESYECPSGYACDDGACKLLTGQCIAGWACVDGSRRGYRDENCIWSNIEHCNSDCVNGQCDVLCSDKDYNSGAGGFLNVKSYCVDSNGTYYDYCVNSNTIADYYCTGAWNGTGWVNNTKRCAAGFYTNYCNCSDGACIK